MKIIILHGLYMNAFVMQPLRQRLQKLGYQTKVLDYSTVSIDANKLYSSIDDALEPEGNNVLLGHSLGGLMIQNYLTSRHPSTDAISHVVTLGSPMQGASIIRVIDEMGLSGILGNSIDFGLEPHENIWNFPQKLGCIAGNTGWGFRPLFMGFDSESDGTVTVEETYIEGMTDHIQTADTHLTLLYSDEVVKQIDHFIQFGKFAIKEPPQTK